MPKIYITFGQIHMHSVNGRTFDKDCVAVIECNDEEHGRARAFELFGPTWHQAIYEDMWDAEDLRYYPRGLINVENEHG